MGKMKGAPMVEIAHFRSVFQVRHIKAHTPESVNTKAAKVRKGKQNSWDGEIENNMNLLACIRSTGYVNNTSELSISSLVFLRVPLRPLR
jgi:hypothetical protein